MVLLKQAQWSDLRTIHMAESIMRRNILSYKKSSHNRNPGKLCLRNPEFWALESGIQLKESGIPVKPSSTYKDWNPVAGIRNPWLTWIPFHRVKELFQIWFLCLFFFERTFCFTKFFLQEVLRKNKVFHFSKKSRYSCYWGRKTSIYTSCLKHLTSSIIRKSKKLRAVWESRIISASSCSSSATPPGVATFANFERWC